MEGAGLSEKKIFVIVALIVVAIVIYLYYRGGVNISLPGARVQEKKQEKPLTVEEKIRILEEGKNPLVNGATASTGMTTLEKVKILNQGTTPGNQSQPTLSKEEKIKLLESMKQ